MDWQKAPDIHLKIKQMIKICRLAHLLPKQIVCFRSFGSKSPAQARIWSLPRVWQKALGVLPHYVIEVLSEKFDKLSLKEQKKVLLHELLHIPKNFSGSLLPHHRGRKRIEQIVEKLFRQYQKNL